jgi:multiple sugar transport system permease protein
MLIYAALAGGAFLMAIPFLWMISTSLKGPGEIYVFPPRWLPDPPHWDNYARMWHAFEVRARILGVIPVHAGLLVALMNSLFVTVTVTLGQLLTCSMAGYAFARLRFPGRDRLFLAYVATLMIPGQILMIPIFILLRTLGWLDSYHALIVPALTSAYGTFLLRQFFLGVPRALMDAATLDGASPWRIYWHVALPLARPALATLTILTFLATWNDFLWPLIVINSPEKMTLPLMLNMFRGLYSTQWTTLMPAAVTVLAPVVIVYLLNQRFITRGFVMSGIKG